MAKVVIKEEFPPLLMPEGLHNLSLNEIEAKCVKEIPLSSTRGLIFRNLSKLIAKLNDIGIRGEIWLNGGFLTEKINPEDCDLVVKIPSGFYEGATVEQKALIDLVRSNLKEFMLCDSYVLFERPLGHPEYEEYLAGDKYWRYWFGHSRAKLPKGIARIGLGL